MARITNFQGTVTADVQCNSLNTYNYGADPDGELFVRFLDTNGDGTGLTNAIGDYSLAAQDFYIQCPENTNLFISKLVIQVEDSGTFDSSSYGNGIELTNGIKIIFEDADSGELDLTADFPIITNVDYAKYDKNLFLSTFGTGNEYLNFTYDFFSLGRPIRLLPGEKWIIRLNDDFEALVSHTFNIQGLRRNL